MATIHLFVLIGGSSEAKKTSWDVIHWVQANIQSINSSGTLVSMEPVEMKDIQSPTTLKKLKDSYGIVGFPALFVPATPAGEKKTYNGWTNIQKALVPFIVAGQSAARRQITDIAAPDSDYDRLLKSDLNMDAQKHNNDEDIIGATLTQADIQKKISAFQMQKPNVEKKGQFNSAVEQDLMGQRADNVAVGRKNVIVPTATNIDDDDALMSSFMANRVGTDD